MDIFLICVGIAWAGYTISLNLAHSQLVGRIRELELLVEAQEEVIRRDNK